MLPIESISMAPKSQEVSHMHQNQIKKEHVQQENIQSGFAYQISHNSKQTVKTSKSEQDDYLKQPRERNKKNGKGNDDSKKESDKEEKNKNIKGSSSFDMKI